MSTKKKKEKPEKVQDGLKLGGGVNYGAVLGHRIDDKRHEREKEYKIKVTLCARFRMIYI
jgi:hypothetical protein